jgi:putative transposase
MNAVTEAGAYMGKSAACLALGLPRSTFHRHEARSIAPREPILRPSPARALNIAERQHVLEVLHSERFIDQAPQQVWAEQLDEGVHLCSVRTMYRILNANDETKERRAQRRHGNFKKPELLATGPNQLWSWDITKLLGPAKWTYFYLYVILDVFSRYVVGWLVAPNESSELAQRLIGSSCEKQRIDRDQLTLHADRGSSMKSKGVALLLADLGVTKTHSRPHVSNDNPYSESQFRTLKYRPEFPERFGSLQHARDFCVPFFGWYNNKHRHSGISLLTPEMVQYGRGEEVLKARHEVLLAAYQAHPNRFVRRPPQPAKPPTAVWINKPSPPNPSEPTVL